MNYFILGLPLIGSLFVPCLVLLITLLTYIKISSYLAENERAHELVNQQKPKKYYRRSSSRNIITEPELKKTEVIPEVPVERVQEKVVEIENVPKTVESKKACCKTDPTRTPCAPKKSFGPISCLKIYYASVGGKAKEFSEKLLSLTTAEQMKTEMIDLAHYEPEDKLPTEQDCCNVFILPTYTDGVPAAPAEWLCKWLEESCNDFRVEHGLLDGVKFAVFGLGNSFYEDNYNKCARRVDKWLGKLQGGRVLPLGLGDENTSASKSGSIEGDFEAWAESLLRCFLQGGRLASCGCKCDKKKPKTSQTAPQASESSDSDSGGPEGVMDMEDLGGALRSARLGGQTRGGMPWDMVTESLSKTLSRQGYHIVGSHSAVKMCRWTKSMLRGRGGCYKHTFYGIESHRCMEATPSLACANKCVFCWRHQSNPVGTEWRWNTDSAEEVLQGALENHYNMISQFKGVPGVVPERLQEGLKAMHCALSLVGEPIMYPHINKFIELLHAERISTFLVTNAQFPNEMRSLTPVTQLYVSVDAASKETLRQIDRPLFRDFWERFQDSLKALKEKQQRTVYRLTLVKQWNVEELKGYADLVSLGAPDFVEIKGVTYCGTSKGSNLTMENVPWHEEVLSFTQQLCEQLTDYELASEHEHSNCLLLAHIKYKREDGWWTWIDFNKFQDLVSTGSSFTQEDYMAKTPEWAVFGSQERGFDPTETRWRRKTNKDISGC